MRRRKAILLGLLVLLATFLLLERVFLTKLESSVIHDDQKIAAFLATLTYPIKIEPGFGFCTEAGEKWGYTYQLCVFGGFIAKNCPDSAVEIQYLGPQSKLSPVASDYHDRELQFRVPVVAADTMGNVCTDYRGADQ